MLKPRLAFLLTEDWFFLSHFASRAQAAMKAGYEVHVIARDNGSAGAITETGLHFHPIEIDRHGLDPLSDLKFLRTLTGLYRGLAPAIVHHVALKPILYGSFAARAAGVPHIVNAPVGMGYVFASSDKRARLLRPLVSAGLRIAMRRLGHCVIVENRLDAEILADGRFADPADIHVVRGAGVDIEAFSPRPEPDGVPVVTLVARMLRDKGIREYAEAGRLLKTRGVPADLQLIGSPDPGNPASIGLEELQTWERQGLVHYLGHRTDIAQCLAQSHIACLPSYREGLPKVLLEAMAAGRAIVATQVPGCSEAVQHLQNGLLVPPRDPQALADALQKLIEDAPLRRRLAKKGREMAETQFATTHINRQTIAIYDALMHTTPAGKPDRDGA